MSRWITTLYRFYDAGGRLLYVGITESLGTRISSHMSTRTWWLDVARIDVANFDSNYAARCAETKAIQTESPLYNSHQNPTPPPRGEAGWKARVMPQTACPACGSDQAINPAGRMVRHNMAKYDEDRITYYGRCVGSGTYPKEAYV